MKSSLRVFKTQLWILPNVSQHGMMRIYKRSEYVPVIGNYYLSMGLRRKFLIE